MSVKSPSTKQKGIVEAFEVEPSSKIAIPSHSYVHATVTFKPTAMQSYNATFEVVPDGIKTTSLVFELQGVGNLPQVSITQPTLYNAKGSQLLLFKKLLLSQSQALPVTLKNTGSIPANVQLENTGSKAFTVMSCSSKDQQDLTPDATTVCSVSLNVDESKDCMVVFMPGSIKNYRSELCVRIQDNLFEKPIVQLVGEGYEDELCLENVRGQVVNNGAEELADDTHGKCMHGVHVKPGSKYRISWSLDIL